MKKPKVKSNLEHLRELDAARDVAARVVDQQPAEKHTRTLAAALGEIRAEADARHGHTTTATARIIDELEHWRREIDKTIAVLKTHK